MADQKKNYHFFRYLDNIIIGEFSGIEEEKPTPPNRLIVYPNPGKGLFKLYYNAHSEEILDIVVLNIIGRVVESKICKVTAGSNEIDINMTNCSAGLYIIKVETPNGIYTKSLISE